MAEKIKLCKDCANYTPCNDYSGWCAAKPVIDYEQGGSGRFPQCQSERLDESRCGHAAKWFILAPAVSEKRGRLRLLLDAFAKI